MSINLLFQMQIWYIFSWYTRPQNKHIHAQQKKRNNDPTIGKMEYISLQVLLFERL